MGLFGRKDKEPAQGTAAAGTRPTMPRIAYCSVCNRDQQFSRCWLRTTLVTQCGCCGQAFQEPRAIYAQNLPACPRCGEFLEHPGFEYGLCDGCGSKFEVVQGTKPGLLPNKQQRDAMNRHGRSRSI